MCCLLSQTALQQLGTFRLPEVVKITFWGSNGQERGFKFSGKKKKSSWLETIKRSDGNNQSLQNVAIPGAGNVFLPVPDTSSDTGPHKVASDCMLSRWRPTFPAVWWDLPQGFVRRELSGTVWLNSCQSRRATKSGALRNNPIWRRRPAPKQKAPVIDNVFQGI